MIIKHRYDGRALHTSAKETLHEALMEAVAAGANLRGAYLVDEGAK